MFILRCLVLIAVILGIAWVLGRMIYALPQTEGRAIEEALPFDPSTTFGQQAVKAQNEHPGLSGVVPLPDPSQALEARIQLAAMSERSLDVMYYIWHDDVSGMLLLEALRRAAERGVRVRLLLDDNGIKGMDPMLAALNQMPNFNVRLFNPSSIRRPKMAGYALSPIRMNRRMHNKAFIVDGAAAIVGGRNIGDEYFAIGDVPAYLDLDVLGVGKVVRDTEIVFDAYWNSASVIELEQIVKGSGSMAVYDAALTRAINSVTADQFDTDDENNPVRRLRKDQVPLEWTHVQVVADDPAKGAGHIPRKGLMISQLGKILGEVDTSMDMISAYFVPAQFGQRYFSRLAENGVEVTIMTNSWQATDVPMVHAGYVKYRRELLEAGVSLLELRPMAGQPSGRDELNPIGSSGASLHAKTFSIDDRRVFIGSYNFDPRSALLNCEMGFLIDSPTMAQNSRESLQVLKQRSYQPFLDEDGKMRWREINQDGSETIHAHEPDLRLVDRVAVYVLNVLPIEWLL